MTLPSSVSHVRMVDDRRVRDLLGDALSTKRRLARDAVPLGLASCAVSAAVFRVVVLDDRGYVECVTQPACNAMVNVGRNIVAAGTFATLRSLTPGIGYLGVGTDSTATAASQTKLNPSVAGSTAINPLDTGASAVALSTATLGGTSGTAGLVTGQSTFGSSSANFAWVEIALFDGSTNGTSNMLDRATFGTLTKASGYTFVPQFTFQAT